jgi:phosphoribosylamine--glycine ligase
MKVLVVGSGGREHVLAWKIAQSPELKKLYVAPGNVGMEDVAECVNIEASDIEGLLAFAKKEKIDLTVVGPEIPLVNGIWDRFDEAGLKVFGPSKVAAQLEASKAFSKELMDKYGIPTADYEIFTSENEAKHYALEADLPIVIKADGLAAGKGVFICESSTDAVNAITQIMSDKVFGASGNSIVIEQMLKGEEVSILAFTDGKKILPLASSQDHKRAYDHDQGPNTGGMGAYSPCPQISKEKPNEIVDKAVRPMIAGMAKDGMEYRGLIYAGVMLTSDGIFVLEYNCRFGDPEAQVVIPRIKSDILPIMRQVAEGSLKTEKLEWHPYSSLGIVLASGGYPGHYEKGFPIKGLESLKSLKDVLVFHAGTAKNEKGDVVTSGGRVLALVALGETIKEAREKAYKHVTQISFSNGFYRKDLGKKAIEVAQ